MIESYPSSRIIFHYSIVVAFMVIKLFSIRKRRNLKNIKGKMREKDEKFRRRGSNGEERHCSRTERRYCLEFKLDEVGWNRRPVQCWVSNDKHKKKNVKLGRVDLLMLYRRLNLEISIEIIHPGDRAKRRNNCLSHRSKKDSNGGIIIY